MELTKDDGSNVITRDIRSLEAMMLAGFELCFTMLEQLMAAQNINAPYSGAGVHLDAEQRARFERIMNEARARFFLSDNN